MNSPPKPQVITETPPSEPLEVKAEIYASLPPQFKKLVKDLERAGEVVITASRGA